MIESDRDQSLDTLLDLDGQVFIVDPAGKYWVRFMVKCVVATPERPHGLNYSFTLHDEQGERLVGFDNAHPMRRSAGPAGRVGTTQDHKHHYKTVRPYEYRDAASLLADFWAEVDAVLNEKGVLK